jgi:hypothetical protein
MDIINFMRLTLCLPTRIVTREFGTDAVKGSPEASWMRTTSGLQGDVQWAKVPFWWSTTIHRFAA